MAQVNGHKTQPTIFDSLPYYDNELEQYPALRQKVEQELARENRPQIALHPNVPPPITLFEVCMCTILLITYFLKHRLQNNPLLRAELERVEKHQPIPPLDTIRYQIPAPSANATEEEWTAALNNAKAQLEHLRIRYDVVCPKN